MKRQYDGLEAVKIPLTSADIATSGNCMAMITLKMEDGVCVSPEYMQQIEYVGDQG